MIRRELLPVIACAGLLGGYACKSETTPPAEAPQTTAGTAERQFTVGDTFGVLRTLHSAEIEHGTLAQQKANDPRVRAFAEKVTGEQKTRLEEDNRVMSSLDIKPRSSETSDYIKTASDRQTARLESMTGSGFDVAYLDEQVDYYRLVIDTIEKDLVPNARDPQVRSMLEAARQRANDNLREAQDLRASVSGGMLR